MVYAELNWVALTPLNCKARRGSLSTFFNFVTGASVVKQGFEVKWSKYEPVILNITVLIWCNCLRLWHQRHDGWLYSGVDLKYASENLPPFSETLPTSSPSLPPSISVTVNNYLYIKTCIFYVQTRNVSLTIRLLLYTFLYKETYRLMRRRT